MAGALTISTLNDSNGVLATQNGMTGIARAWANFAGASGTVNSSFNISSITRNGAGDYTANFTTAMPNANYALSGAGSQNDNSSIACVTANSTTYSTTSIRFHVSYSNGLVTDFPIVNIAVHGA